MRLSIATGTHAELYSANPLYKSLYVFLMLSERVGILGNSFTPKTK